ncbi:unnamed protein product [Cuscuta campestris]|uniref:Reverse transcriptase domain-containing protein n=1 Tax=Cuscuta campestris TaxID=132261 RepID=A0A484N5P6_9ASTE|nr:unnamed protein product [Cuscuta campestris]
MIGLFWNIRGVHSSLRRLLYLIKTYKLQFLSILEPLVDDDQLEWYKLKLGFSKGFFALNNKLWFLWKDDLLSLHTVIEETQILTCGFKYAASSSTLWISSVYGLHSRVEREGLWTSLRSLAPRSEPWIIGGDFNTVVSITEHKGEVCPDLGSIRDFANAISDCELVSPPFLGSQFTWTDGYNDFFFRQAWDVVKIDVVKAVQEFFMGIPLPKVFGSTLITLIPKVEGAITLDQFRPISLSTFFSKILSRILSDRLKKVLPSLISPEQAAFQSGRSINEHVLMVKEMVHLLSSNARGGNCIIKLDLSKAFDRISWRYLEHVLLRFGFSQRVINLLLGNLRSTFFSVLVNGQPKGFFPMKCGVKQGDPLSPLLFILAMEGFTRYLHHLHHTKKLAPSHLLYADDIVDCRNLLRLKAALSHFGNASGQAINFNKSQVIVHDKMRQEHKAKIRSILGIRCHTREFTYLGSVIVKGKLRKIHCQGLLQKFERRIAAWYSRKLNQMGRLILIKHVLSSIPLHILAVQEIPRSIVKCLHMLMANFFWGARDMGHKYHWRKWEKLCFPLLEGGLGVRDLGNCQRAAAMDLWWKIKGESYGLMVFIPLGRFMLSPLIINLSNCLAVIFGIKGIFTKEISGLWCTYAAAAKAPIAARPWTFQQQLLSWWFSSNKNSFLGNVHKRGCYGCYKQASSTMVLG